MYSSRSSSVSHMCHSRISLSDQTQQRVIWSYQSYLQHQECGKPQTSPSLTAGEISVNAEKNQMFPVSTRVQHQYQCILQTVNQWTPVVYLLSPGHWGCSDCDARDD